MASHDQGSKQSYGATSKDWMDKPRFSEEYIESVKMEECTTHSKENKSSIKKKSVEFKISSTLIKQFETSRHLKGKQQKTSIQDEAKGHISQLLKNDQPNASIEELHVLEKTKRDALVLAKSLDTIFQELGIEFDENVSFDENNEEPLDDDNEDALDELDNISGVDHEVGDGTIKKRELVHSIQKNSCYDREDRVNI